MGDRQTAARAVNCAEGKWLIRANRRRLWPNQRSDDSITGETIIQWWASFSKSRRAFRAKLSSPVFGLVWVVKSKECWRLLEMLQWSFFFQKEAQLGLRWCECTSKKQSDDILFFFQYVVCENACKGTVPEIDSDQMFLHSHACFAGCLDHVDFTQLKTKAAK